MAQVIRILLSHCAKGRIRRGGGHRVHVSRPNPWLAEVVGSVGTHTTRPKFRLFIFFAAPQNKTNKFNRISRSTSAICSRSGHRARRRLLSWPCYTPCAPCWPTTTTFTSFHSIFRRRSQCSNYMEARACRAPSLVTTAPTLCGKFRVYRGGRRRPPHFCAPPKHHDHTRSPGKYILLFQ